MSEEELFFSVAMIIAVLVILPRTIIKGILSYQREKKASAAAEGVSMRELEARIEQAVVRATRPLQEQIASLEARLEESRALPRQRRRELDEWELQGGALLAQQGEKETPSAT